MIVDNYIYGVKLGGWHTNVANGTKTRNRWKMLQMVCYSTKGYNLSLHMVRNLENDQLMLDMVWNLMGDEIMLHMV